VPSKDGVTGVRWCFK